MSLASSGSWKPRPRPRWPMGRDHVRRRRGEMRRAAARRSVREHAALGGLRRTGMDTHLFVRPPSGKDGTKLPQSSALPVSDCPTARYLCPPGPPDGGCTRPRSGTRGKRVPYDVTGRREAVTFRCKRAQGRAVLAGPRGRAGIRRRPAPPTSWRAGGQPPAGRRARGRAFPTGTPARTGHPSHAESSSRRASRRPRR